MITFALVIVYMLLSYVAGWSCFISNNEGGFLPWICYMLSPITYHASQLHSNLYGIHPIEATMKDRNR